MNAMSGCPAPDRLQEYRLGGISGDTAVALERHLASCPECRKRLAASKAAPAEAHATAITVPPSSAAEESIPDGGHSLAPPRQPDEIGRLGGYRILKELGRGGMGVVYQAEDLKLKRPVALKVMMPGLAAAPDQRQRFLREAQAMAAVRHDHVVTVFEVNEDRGVPFLAMEFLTGMPLDQWLKSGRKTTLTQVLRIGREVAEGLAAAHAIGLIHRDIKPGNLWLDSTHKGRVKILDFGLARSGKEDVHLTQTGAIMGTPAYMAPEQARSEKVDGRCDLFSLGCVLYRLLTGEMPFQGDNTVALLMAVAMENPKPVREINPDAPAALAELVMRLLEKDPAKRPQTAREVARALQAMGSALAEAKTAVMTPAAAAAPAVGAQTTVEAPPARRKSATRRQRSPAASGAGGWKRRPWVGAAFLAAVITVVVVVIRNKNGDKIAEINVPPGGTVEIVDDGKQGGAGIAPKAAEDEAWVMRVAALPAAEQVKAVGARLKELNPGFDGAVAPTIEKDAVTGLKFTTDHVTDISPVRALTHLQTLDMGSYPRNDGLLFDLSPLQGMPLVRLDCGGTRVADLSPLKGMKLYRLGAQCISASDLTPLQGMPLKSLDLAYAQGVSNVKPLQGMPLEYLNLSLLPVSDLSALKDMTSLKDLILQDMTLSDLAPLSGLRLHRLYLDNSKVSDLTPLQGAPLEEIKLTPQNITRGLDVLRDMKSLKTIGISHNQIWPAAEFWARYDKGEFQK